MAVPAWRSRLSSVGNAYTFERPTRTDALAAAVRAPLDRAFLRRATDVADLDRIGAVLRKHAPPADGPHVVVATLRAWPDHDAFEAVVAAALRMRGARVTMLTCGGGLPLCEMGWARRAWPRPCDRCAPHTAGVVERLGLPHETLASALPWGSDGRRAAAGADAGHASGAPDGPPGASSSDGIEISRAWILRTSQPDTHEDGAAVGADLQIGADGVRQAAAALFDRLRPDVLLTVNGLFSTEDALREIAGERGIRCPTYEISPRAGALTFSQGTPAPEYDTDHAWATCRDRPLDAEQRSAIEGLLADRRAGVGAHETYFEAVELNHLAVRREAGVPDGARMATVFTNLTWDSAALGRDVGFDGMLPFLEQAAREVDEIEGLHLVVRVHPAETRWRTRETVEQELRDRLGNRFPSSVHVIAPDRSLSSYALLDASDVVLGYTTTTGLEAAASGTPVLVAGDVHYRDRGFTHDLEGPADLRRLLRDLPPRLDDDRRELALRYAFTFFFRGFVPLRPVDVQAGVVSTIDATAARLGPRGDPHLDWLASRLLDGEDFLLPDDLALA